MGEILILSISLVIGECLYAYTVCKYKYIVRYLAVVLDFPCADNLKSGRGEKTNEWTSSGLNLVISAADGKRNNPSWNF
jgi:hypothetical protein